MFRVNEMVEGFVSDHAVLFLVIVVALTLAYYWQYQRRHRR